MNREKWKNKSFFTALGHCINGIKYTLKNEKNFKIQILLAIVVIICGIFFKLQTIEFAVLFITIGMVLLAELINTAIEVMLDIYSQEYDENIKIMKDISSGAVLVTSIIAVLVGISLFLPKILNVLI